MRASPAFDKTELLLNLVLQTPPASAPMTPNYRLWVLSSPIKHQMRQIFKELKNLSPAKKIVHFGLYWISPHWRQLPQLLWQRIIDYEWPWFLSSPIKHQMRHIFLEPKNLSLVKLFVHFGLNWISPEWRQLAQLPWQRIIDAGLFFRRFVHIPEIELSKENRHLVV